MDPVAPVAAGAILLGAATVLVFPTASLLGVLAFVAGYSLSGSA